MSYLCNCGKEFEHPQERTGHMSTCFTAELAEIEARSSLTSDSEALIQAKLDIFRLIEMVRDAEKFREEYNNLCKFTNDIEANCAKLQARLDKTVDSHVIESACLETCEAKLSIAMKVLEFYSKNINYENLVNTPIEGSAWYRHPIMVDKGNIARQALAEIEKMK